jgi:hypothetical protein
MNNDDDKQYLMSEWLEFSIVLLITLISLAAFCFWLGYLL